MRTALALAAATFLAAGCNKSEEGGAKGTDNSFTFTLPTVGPTIKQDTSESVTVKLNRGKEFKQNVKLTVSAPDKVKAELAKTMVAASDPAEVPLKLMVAKDAPVGEHKVTVTATPDTGSPVSNDFTVKVTTP